MNELLRRLRVLFRRDSFDADLDEEMRAHIEMQAEENRDNGMDPAEARYAAQRQFGNAVQLHEECRELWLTRAFDSVRSDIRYALRTLTGSPAFTAVAVLSLALGIGANTALFSLINVILLRELPVRNPHELVEFIRTSPSGAMMTNLPFPVFDTSKPTRPRFPTSLPSVGRIPFCGPMAKRSALKYTAFPAPSSPRLARAP